MEYEKNENLVQEPEEKKDTKGFAYEVYSLLHDFAFILAAVTILFVFVVRLVGVDGSSMFPTLEHGDYLLLESNFLSDDYKAGDVVVMTVPDFDNSNPIVKRIIATEGQRVDIDYSTGIVYVDGEPLEESYIHEPTFMDYNQYGVGITLPDTVPEGCVFVLGDNRNHSTDSRHVRIGMVDTRRIMGKVLCIAFPGQGQPGFSGKDGQRDFSRIGGAS